MSVHTTLKTNWSQLEKELDRLDAMPNLKVKLALDSVLASGFKATQAQVHVITGSLKSSGKKSSDIQGDDWEGEISYGGVSAGVNNPVTYAIYEKARDEDHDFMKPLEALNEAYIKAILKVLS